MNNNYLDAPWDPINSTYKQEIYFANGKKIDGYSCREGFEEVRDKKKLLINWVLRNYKAGYLDKESEKVARKIDMFWLPEGQTPVLIVSIKPTHIEWNPSSYRNYLDNFFTKFFKLIESGKNPYQILYIKSKSPSIQDLDYKIKRFFNKKNLRSFCIEQIQHKIHPSGQVKNYYQQYCNEHLEGLGSQDEDFIKSINFDNNVNKHRLNI